MAALGNSLLISLVTTAVAVLIGVFTAYALSRYDFPGKGIVTGIILAASMFPAIALVSRSSSSLAAWSGLVPTAR